MEEIVFSELKEGSWPTYHGLGELNYNYTITAWTQMVKTRLIQLAALACLLAGLSLVAFEAASAGLVGEKGLGGGSLCEEALAETKGYMQAYRTQWHEYVL